MFYVVVVFLFFIIVGEIGLMMSGMVVYSVFVLKMVKRGGGNFML